MKILITIQTLICLIFSLPAQSLSRELTLRGRVQDFVTHVDIPGSLVELLNAKDSSLIASKEAITTYQNENESWATAEFWMSVPRKEGDYILRFTKDGYATTYVNLPLHHFYKREVSRDIETVYLKRTKEINLGEVEITASKVKFYSKGDTIVYNADAFQMGEGSMLDALIRQMPGAELRKDGQIYVNGKFVENLLLNGKDFFRGDNSVMLEYLPTYMVSQVKVYDQLGDHSKFVGHEVAGDKIYVMDVLLKKQYNIGWMGNIEAGGGSKERFLARLFTMRFTDHSRLAIYGNVNNLNDNRKPGEDDSWSPSDLVSGQMTQQMAGIDYNIDARNNKFKLSGNAQISHADNNIENKINRTNFLDDGNTYDRMLDNTRNHNLRVSTDHRFYFEFKQANLEIKPNFTYRQYRNLSNYASLTLSKDIDEHSLSQYDSLYTPRISRDLLRTTINRNLRRRLVDGYTLQGALSAQSILKLKHSPDIVTFYADFSFRHASENAFDNNRIDYFAQEKITTTDYRNRYFHNRPDHGYGLTGKVSYNYVIKNGMSIDYSYKYNRKTTYLYSSLYRLDQLAGWGAGNEQELGTLPSIDAYSQVIDATNSYNSKQTDNTHTAEAFFVWTKQTDKSQWWAQLVPNLSLLSRTLHYQRGDIDTTLTKKTVLFNMYSTHIQWNSTDQKYQFAFQYHIDAQEPQMNLFVNILDSSDPLNMYVGNSNLKPSYKHEIISHFMRMYPEKGVMWLIEAQYIPTVNALAMGYTYDKTTGKRTFRPDNVNGNWRGQLSIGGSGVLNKQGTLNLRTMLGTRYDRSVDLIGLEGSASSNRSVVTNSALMWQVNLDYNFGSSSIGLKSEGNWSRVSGNRDNFKSFNVADFNYGLTAQLQLPWAMRLGTDLTMYSRNGYIDKAMNSNDLVWNARLSRTFNKGRFVVMVDAFDILRQLNSVTRVMNAQGITETYSNVIPRYVLLHATYRFNVMPKKK